MSADHEPGSGSFGRRLERWTRDSAQLQGESGLVVGSAEDQAVRRYRESATGAIPLPAPSISHHRYDALSRRHRDLRRRLLATVVLVVPLLLVTGILVGPVAAKVAVLALLAAVAGLVVHDSRAIRRVDRDRHLTLTGGLADAWAAWVAARTQLESLDDAAQARAALAANELRMQALVLALARAESRPGHQDTEEHAASREWVYRSAAKAVALAAAERELRAATQREFDVGELQFAPDGDLDALDNALDTARALTRGMVEPPE